MPDPKRSTDADAEAMAAEADHRARVIVSNLEHMTARERARARVKLSNLSELRKRMLSLSLRSASARTRQEPDDVSSYGLVDIFLEESIAIDDPSSTFPSNCENIMEGVADYVSSSDEYPGYSSEESSSPKTVPDNTTGYSPQSDSSLGKKILVHYYVNCHQFFYIRMDKRGLFLTYPDVGGPVQSIDEAKHATENFFDELWREEKSKEFGEFSHVEGIMDDRKYYLRGPPKRTTSPSSKTTYDEKRYLIRALLDQYNDDKNFVGNHAHELEDLLGKQLIYENNRWYHHFNFTTKQKEDDYNPNNAKKLFFAEVSHLQGEKTLEVNCCCMIDPHPNGVVCQGCINNGSPYMMHPSNTALYAGGQLNGYLPFGCLESSGSEDEEEYFEEEEEEAEEDEDDEDLMPWCRWEDRNKFLV